jgi:predicted glycoside hydrolase/deacetylase ChbG (UPF0249 family)
LLVINADDFGLSPGVNEGILEAYTAGVVTSASLMVLVQAAREAADAAARHPALSVGLHFVGDQGVNFDDRRSVAQAFEAQLDRFRELTGHDPTHVDSHHHVHTASEARLAMFGELVSPLEVPLRRDGRVAYIGGFWAQPEPGVTDLECVSRRALIELVRAQAIEGFTELACHPARLLGDFSSSYLQEREAELETLTGTGLREEIEGLGVRLVSYLEWRAGLGRGG